MRLRRWRSIWADLGKEHTLDGQTATVYHFGYDRATDSHRPFIYRSTNNFESETQILGLGMKPAPLGEVEGPTSIEDIVALANRIRDEQAELPPAERIYIGGELVLTTLDRDTFNIQIIHTFDDHVDDWQAMNGAEPFNR